VLRTDDLDYHLPEELIATRAAEPRDSARLMVVSRRDPSRVEHLRVRDLPSVLGRGDMLVFNTTRVIPARLEGVRRDTGGKVSGLYLATSGGTAVQSGRSGGTGFGGTALQSGRADAVRWVAFIKARRFRAGAIVDLFDNAGRPTEYALRLVERDGANGAETASAQGQGMTGLETGPAQADPTREVEQGAWIVEVLGVDPTTDPGGMQALERVGHTPLPPYILGKRRRAGERVEDAEDRARYQTVYAGGGSAGAGRADAGASSPSAGSVAAPTAGLHFTPELLGRLDELGVERADVVLHVGSGTFKPVETEFIEQHRMHSEMCSMSPETIARVRAARQAGRRVIAVGTTSARTLESYAKLEDDRSGDRSHQVNTPRWPGWLDTNLLITPGYQWRWTGGLLTNFHLPRSTLLAMVSSLLTPAGGEPMEGVRRLLGLYELAVREGYRFYSYGDAMVVVE
jgi:S-adenosylmethionine:tRNA ribosyltransferase-isomerase